MVYLLAHDCAEIASETKLIVTVPPHPSVAETKAIFGAGTNEAQETLIDEGHVMLGAVISLTVIVCVQVAVFRIGQMQYKFLLLCICLDMFQVKSHHLTM